MLKFWATLPPSCKLRGAGLDPFNGLAGDMRGGLQKLKIGPLEPVGVAGRGPGEAGIKRMCLVVNTD